MNTEQVIERWQQVPHLRGDHVSLEPLTMGHADGLRAALGDGELSRCWYTNVPTPDGVETYIADALEVQDHGRMLPFVARSANGEIVGTTRYYELDPTVPKLSIGYTWYATHAQRTGINTEAKLLLLTHAFEVLGCITVTFETSWFNHASRTAIARLGAKQDGVLRNHKRHSDGSPRDTVVFSIIDNEWPAVKRNLQFKLEQRRDG
ncbi:MAG TPA: GNAT family N-acetyltransferase [Lysobacter sp.]|jgi:RimJ/RimL family protein N-acetyltransferase|nr:GNAT family N-acetyltransferase [Lysobacter sp.]